MNHLEAGILLAQKRGERRGSWLIDSSAVVVSRADIEALVCSNDASLFACFLFYSEMVCMNRITTI